MKDQVIWVLKTTKRIRLNKLKKISLNVHLNEFNFWLTPHSPAQAWNRSRFRRANGFFFLHQTSSNLKTDNEWTIWCKFTFNVSLSHFSFGSNQTQHNHARTKSVKFYKANNLFCFCTEWVDFCISINESLYWIFLLITIYKP